MMVEHPMRPLEATLSPQKKSTKRKVHLAFIADCFRTLRVLLQFDSIMQLVKFGIMGLSNTIISYGFSGIILTNILA